MQYVYVCVYVCIYCGRIVGGGYCKNPLILSKIIYSPYYLFTNIIDLYSCFSYNTFIFLQLFFKLVFQQYSEH